jgi:hypothetical protein
MSEPKRPPFRPTKEQARDIFYTLNGDSDEFPRELSDPNFLPLPFLKGSNVLEFLVSVFVETWGARSENYYNLLLLESSLPCKQQQFEILILSRERTVISLVRQLNNIKESLESGELELEDADVHAERRVRAVCMSFNVLHEEWDNYNIIFERGVGVGWTREDKERLMTDCTILMSLVKEKLDRDANSQKKGPLTPGHILRLRVWNEQKDVLDKFKKDLESFKKRTKDLPKKGPRATNQVDESSAFKGSQQGLGRKRKTKRRKIKKRKTLRYKNKRK